MAATGVCGRRYGGGLVQRLRRNLGRERGGVGIVMSAASPRASTPAQAFSPKVRLQAFAFAGVETIASTPVHAAHFDNL